MSVINNKTQAKNWPRVRLGGVATLITKGTTPTTVGGKFTDKGINFIKVESIAEDGHFIFNKFDHIDESTNKLLKRSVIKEDDILYSIAGAIGRVALVTKKELPANINQALAIIRLNPEKVYPKYLFYALSTRFQKIFANNLVAQSVQANINLKQVGDLEINLPEIKEQKKITDILSAFDNKIELNNKINQNLEQTTQAIFKKWFGNNKLGDKNGKLNDLMDIISGFPFSSKIYNPTKGFGVVTIKNVQDGNFVREFDSFIKNEDLPKKINKNCILEDGDILLSLTGNVGRVCIVYGGKYLLNQRVAKIKSKNEKDLPFCYFLLRQVAMRNILINMAKGSAQPNLSPIETGEIEFAVPSRDLLDDFSKIATPIYHKIIKGINENQKLASLRDSLLSKLMSGEIRV